MVVGGTGRGGDPATKKGQMVVGGRGRGRVGSTPELPRVVIKERCEQNGGNNGKGKEPTIGKGKEPVIAKAKVPIPWFGGAGTIAPSLGLQTHRFMDSSSFMDKCYGISGTTTT
ncbi:hypothetical protein RHMOL_Rhmol08G0176500 [Rhododendron molle]|uniref:Uncharacterized protein n=1 Tax=Rhododendron molle TaxID=49168 RepID=A0ACC0MPT0_RHOML|nr:hypothetical protein RHMOL_Rhmol08G0176500 [Rhododendron molle]